VFIVSETAVRRARRKSSCDADRTPEPFLTVRLDSCGEILIDSLSN
jgi:hypothetical protein